MEISELRDCNDERLTELEKTLRRQIFDARIKNYTNQLDDTASIRRVRRDLARVMTIMRERVGLIVSPPVGPATAVEETTDE